MIQEAMAMLESGELFFSSMRNCCGCCSNLEGGSLMDAP
jgi:hypothetical protein